MEYNQSEYETENNRFVGNKWQVLKNVTAMQQYNSKIFTLFWAFHSTFFK